MPNLGLAVVIFFNFYYYLMFALATAVIYLYKLLSLPYPGGSIASELTIYVFLCCIEGMRLFFGRKGNLTNAWQSLLASLLLTGPSILGVLYFLLWQTYVLRIEVILVYVELVFELLVFILGLLQFVTLLYYKG